MTDVEATLRALEQRVDEVEDRVDLVEARQEELKGLPDAVSELTGAVTVLREFMVNHLPGVQTSVEKFSSLKTAITFASVVVVPVVVALIGGYFLLKSQGTVGR